MAKCEGKFIEQIIRPTGLLEPNCEIRPAKTQVDDLIGEVKKVKEQGFRTLVTTLTKKMAEDLTDYLSDIGINVVYMHSDVDTLDRIEIIQNLRLGKHDCLVGVNLLREGLDIPECALVAILDADKEGFLRNETALIQTIGRAARNEKGRVILYADKETKSIVASLDKVNRRREVQIAYNKKHNITPRTTHKAIGSALANLYNKKELDFKDDVSDEMKQILSAARQGNSTPLDKKIETMKKEMLTHAANLDFEKAAKLRDQVHELEALKLKL
jgi:excinuclease ABC subunit B